MSHPDWQWRFFNGSPRARLFEKFGLLDAPPIQTPSHALQQWREANAAEAARVEQREVAIRRELDMRGQELREGERAERWKPLVVKFGAEAVEVLQRRIDPTFELPGPLRGMPAKQEE